MWWRSDPPEGVARSGLEAFDLVDELEKWAELAVAVRGVADVVDEARRIGQVLRLAVAQREAREDVGHLQVALQAHPFHRTVEGAEVAVPVFEVHQAGLAGLFPVAHGDVDDE